MAINKVNYGGQTLIDTSEDTAETGDVLAGKTFHSKSGSQSTGKLVLPEGVPHVELTQAEYDALTPAQKENGSVYFITDGDDTAYSGIIGSGELETEANTLVGAINELGAQVPSLVDSGLISSGFVAPANGMVKLHCTSGGGSNWYYTSVGYICMTGGLTQEASFPISKGETFSVSSTADSSRVWARYYKFSMS